MYKAAIIIAFYNKIDYLRMVLAGLERNSFKDFQVIIADDGSSKEVTDQILEIISKTPLKLTHLWHEDHGFRKNKILNKAIISAESDYLIFIDGDCVPHKEFIKEHYNNRKENVCLTGRRVNLSERITGLLTPEKCKQGFLENKFLLLALDGIFGKSFDVEKGLYFKSDTLRSFFNSKKRGILGCNFSVFKKDIININGFDERYEAPSIGEDSDIQFRLELNGILIKSLNNIAVQYHLYHKIQLRPEKNLKLFEEVIASKIAYTPYGIIQN